jgi:primosomal protein N' (replication factor Y)
VTLVGVLNCDASLHIPDFRAQESVFQLITQVAGRAGRGESPGEVIIQTALPDNSTILQAAAQDYMAFYNDEIAVRKAFCFPPYCKIVKCLFSGKDEARLFEFTCRFQDRLKNELPGSFVLHPVNPPGHAKVKDHYRYQFLIRGPQIAPICNALEAVDKELIIPSSIQRYIDVDPTHIF